MLVSERIVALIFLGSLAMLFVAEAKLLLRLIRAKVRRQPVKVSRKAWVAHLLSAGFLVCAAYGYWIEPYWIDVTHITVPTGKLASSLRIVQFSDTHCEGKLRNEERLVEIINSFDADIVVFTGDSLNTQASLATFKTRLSRMRAKRGKYAVRGNFDCWLWGGLDLFSDTGFIELADGRQTIDVDGRKVAVSGASCMNPEAYGRLLDGVPQGAFSIFLYHYPDLIEEVAAKGADLYLAGHTHGGQVALPFYGAMVTLARHGKKYEAGRYEVGKTTLYVNRGIGMEAGYVPRVRFLARPEVTVIDIVPAEDDGAMHRTLQNGEQDMFSLLKRLAHDGRSDWARTVQAPGVPFRFPAGAQLRPLEDVVIAFPTAIFGQDKTIGSVLQCDDNAEFSVPPDSDMAYIRLKAGMVLSLTVSCELVICADDSQPRGFEVRMPAATSK